MAIECYYSQCKYHSANFSPDEGPFCDEKNCRMTEAETVQFELQRQYGKELKDAEGNSENTKHSQAEKSQL